MKLLMSTKRQFKMYLDEDLVERLKQAATRFSRDSGQDIVEEIVSIYLPTWIAVNDSMRRAVEYQTKLISPKGERKANAKNGVPAARIELKDDKGRGNKVSDST